MPFSVINGVKAKLTIHCTKTRWIIITDLGPKIQRRLIKGHNAHSIILKNR